MSNSNSNFLNQMKQKPDILINHDLLGLPLLKKFIFYYDFTEEIFCDMTILNKIKIFFFELSKEQLLNIEETNSIVDSILESAREKSEKNVFILLLLENKLLEIQSEQDIRITEFYEITSILNSNLMMKNEENGSSSTKKISNV